MKKVSMILIASALLLCCDTPSDFEDREKSTFVKYYGGDGDQSGVDMVRLSDGIVLLANAQFGTSKSMLLIKVDFAGNEMSRAELGGPSDVAVDLEQYNDSDLVVLARHEESLENSDVRLWRMRVDGNEFVEVDSVTYQTNYIELPKSVTPLADGGFIVSGSTLYEPDSNPDDPQVYSNIFNFRCDATLDFDFPNWSHYYGGPSIDDSGTKVVEWQANSFYLFGSTNSLSLNQTGNLTMVYAELKSVGELANIRWNGDNDQNTASSFVLEVPAALGDGYLHFGTRLDPAGPTTLHVTRLRADLSFNPQQDEQFDKGISVASRPVEAVAASAAQYAAPQGFLLLSDEIRNIGARNILLQKIDLSGSLQWTITLGSEEGNDTGAAVMELEDGRILVLGTVELGDNQTKMALFKLNERGRLQ